MDAGALLAAQGWRGKGHSLHKTDDKIGLAKPLLLNRKDNTKGLGTTQHFTSDQWWMNAFDEQLKGLETSKSGKVTQTIKTGKLNAIENGSLGKYSLYTSFVRGGLLEGTLTPGYSTTTTDSDETSDDTPKMSESEGREETAEERKARKEAKKRRAAEKAVRRQEKALRRAQKGTQRQSEAADSAISDRGRRKDTSKSDKNGKDKSQETKEERKARKAEKRKRRTLDSKKG